MIAVYAQATERSGLDVAIDGARVGSDDQRFAVLREKSMALNLRQFDVEVRGVTIHCGMGIARLQFEPLDPDVDDSPIVVVLPARSFRESSEPIASTIMNSVSAIGRKINVDELAQALGVAAKALRIIRMRHLIAIGVGVSVTAFAAVLIARGLIAPRE